MDELVGFIFMALGGLLVVMISVEIYSTLGTSIRRRRRAEEHRPNWFDDSPPTEPGYHLGGAGFHLDGSEHLLHRRHRRRLELEPRGSFGFAAKWIRDP